MFRKRAAVRMDPEVLKTRRLQAVARRIFQGALERTEEPENLDEEGGSGDPWEEELGMGPAEHNPVGEDGPGK